MTKKSLFFLILTLCSLHLFGQVLQEVIPPDFIKSVSLRGVGNDSYVPFVQKGDGIILEFDDLYGDEVDYYYRIVHCDSQWKPSDLSKSEYIRGLDEQRISDYKNSLNTLQIYTHYTLSLPNERTALKLSGNYMIEVLDKDYELVFSRKLVVFEPLANVEVYAKRARDMKDIQQKQSVQFIVNTAGYQIDNPTQNIKIVVLQNHQWNSELTNLKPQFTAGYNLVYKYDKETSFWGGNEYFNFDSKDIRTSTDRVYASKTEDDGFHSYLYPDEVRADQIYTYYPDINGNFVIRTMQGQDSTIESEYVWVHFSLQDYFEVQNRKVHVYGAFNNYTVNDQTLLEYNKLSKTYQAAFYLKQGFYNYTYVVENPDGSIDKQSLNGSHFQTENTYSILVYYRKFGDRHESLIGFGEGNSSYITD
jgi:hypothetical protein